MKKKLIFICLIQLTLVMSSCREVSEPDSVNLQLKWVHQAQFAGFYAAESQGYFQESELDVNLQPGGPEVDLEESIRYQSADFWILSGEQLLEFREQGLPLVAVAVIYQQNPMVFISLAEHGFESPEDLEQHTLGLAPDGEVVFQALVNQLDLNPTLIELVDYDRNYDSLKTGDVDFTQAYVTGGVIRLEEEGYDLNLIWPADYGIHFYADTLVTTEKMIQDQPDLVDRFVNSSLRGWQQAVRNPDQTVRDVMIYAPESDKVVQENMLQSSIPLVHTGDFMIGEMNPVIWQEMQDTLHSQGILEEVLDVESLFTNQFLAEPTGDH